jgi:hypothetical protein
MELVYGIPDTHLRRSLIFASRNGVTQILSLNFMHVVRLCSVVACRRASVFFRVPSASMFPINQVDQKADDCESSKSCSDANASLCSDGEVAL